MKDIRKSFKKIILMLITAVTMMIPAVPASAQSVYVNMRPDMHYCNQGHSSACESASLKMALEIKGEAYHISLWHFTKGYVHYGYNKKHKKSARKEYTYDPFRHTATIYPTAERRVASQYGVRSKIIDYSRQNTIIYYLEHNDPIVMEAGHRGHATWDGYRSDHSICLIGYLHNRYGEFVKYADPNCASKNTGIGWVKLHTLMHSYHRPSITGERALVVE